jgi:soluble cytochrome b562
MADTLETLEVKITGDTHSAEESLNNLVGGLDNLQKAATSSGTAFNLIDMADFKAGFDILAGAGADLDRLTGGLAEIQTGLKQVADINLAPNVNTVADYRAQFDELVGSVSATINSMSSLDPDIISAITAIDPNINIDVSSFESLKGVLSAVSDQLDLATDKVELLDDGLKEIAKADLSSLSGELGKLRTGLGQVADFAPNLNTVADYKAQFDELVDSVFTATAALKALDPDIDTSSFDALKDKLSEVSVQIDGATDKVDLLDEEFEENDDTLKELIKQYAAMAAAVAVVVIAYNKIKDVVLGVVNVVVDLVKAYGQQATAERTLTAVINANQRSADGLLDTYKDFAAEMQILTTTGDEHTLSLLQQAESLDHTGEAAERVVRNALGLSAAFPVAAREAINMASALEEGNTGPLNRLFRGLQNIEDQSERVAEANRLVANTFSVAEAEAAGIEGSIQQLNNQWGDYQQVVGGMLVQGEATKGLFNDLTLAVGFMIEDMQDAETTGLADQFDHVDEALNFLLITMIAINDTIELLINNFSNMATSALDALTAPGFSEVLGITSEEGLPDLIGELRESARLERELLQITREREEAERAVQRLKDEDEERAANLAIFKEEEAQAVRDMDRTIADEEAEAIKAKEDKTRQTLKDTEDEDIGGLVSDKISSGAGKGSAEAIATIQSSFLAGRGGGGGPEPPKEATQREQLTVMREVRDSLRDIAAREPAADVGVLN